MRRRGDRGFPRSGTKIHPLSRAVRGCPRRSGLPEEIGGQEGSGRRVGGRTERPEARGERGLARLLPLPPSAAEGAEPGVRMLTVCVRARVCVFQSSSRKKYLALRKKEKRKRRRQALARLREAGSCSGCEIFPSIPALPSHAASDRLGCPYLLHVAEGDSFQLRILLPLPWGDRGAATMAVCSRSFHAC